MFKRVTIGFIAVMLHCYCSGQTSMAFQPVMKDTLTGDYVQLDSVSKKKKPELSPEEKFKLDHQRSIDQFLSANENWYLFAVGIDESRLRNNLPAKEDLLIEAIGTYAQGLIYAESDSVVLLTERRNIYQTVLYGQKKPTTKAELEILHRGNCPACLSTLKLKRTLSGDSLIVEIPDDAAEKSDVVYLLTFKK